MLFLVKTQQKRPGDLQPMVPDLPSPPPMLLKAWVVEGDSHLLSLGP